MEAVVSKASFSLIYTDLIYLELSMRKINLFTFLQRTLGNMNLSKEDYYDVQEEIQENNAIILFVTSFFLSIIFLFLFVFTFFPFGQMFIMHRFLYILMFMAFIMIFALAGYIYKITEGCFLFLCYFEVFIFIVYSVILGIYHHPNTNAVTYIIIMFVWPILFLDKVWRSAIFFGISCIFFCIESVLNKPFDIAYIDILNVLISYVLSICFTKYANFLRIRDFLALHMIEIERDTDPLVGVLNKQALVREIKKNILVSNKTGIMIYLDIDNFKSINETFGFEVGDEVLRQIGDCFRDIFRSTDIIGRYMSDEFVVFMPKIGNLDIAKVRSKMLMEFMEKEIHLPDENVKVHGSIGIARCSKNGDTYKSLKSKVDDAVYEAKCKGKNQIVINEN